MRWRTRSSSQGGRLDELVRKVSSYALQLIERPQDSDLYPQVIATATGESYLAVLAALRVLEEQGVVTPKYGVFCSQDDSTISEVDSLAEAKSLVADCNVCEHERGCPNDDAYVDLYFIINRAKLRAFLAQAA